ncbi:MAG: reprolysin-like metallopeptidase [Rudaea sp.]
MGAPRTAFWLALLMSAQASAAVSVFRDRLADPAIDTASLNAPLHNYRALNLDIDAVRSQLSDAPDEHTSTPASTIELPLPDGTTQRFNVWRTQVMAPTLAARYPQIRSFVARAIDHPETEARLDDSPHGFSAMIRSADGVSMLQPIRIGEAARYIIFRRTDLGATNEPFQCLEDKFASSMRRHFDALLAAPQTSTGANVRTYRLAVAATGEYTTVFGGTVADGMAAIVQAINRINGIYLTEFAVQFQLVNNNDQLVYTNPSTDPYTNTSGRTMLGQNQTTIDSVIGTANYDFGHVFSTGGGGVAFVGVACNGSLKAQGVTGSTNPVGDAFWVDYVAHEMGHQMGSAHSFNSISGFCKDNRAASQAAEPGSGSTIMAYAGICGPSDLQPHSDPFFHAISLTPIEQTLITSGAACGTVLTTTNHAPVVASVSARTIPMQTAFALAGAATDADNDPVTYIWEEMDLGTQSPPEGDNGTRPVFRSFVPTTSPTRLLPELARILSHNPNDAIPADGDISGESWPTTTRDLKFRLTVRDNHPGGSATTSTDALVHVTATAGPFRVTAPATNAQWHANEAKLVSWNVANTNVAPVDCAAVDILYSSDGGQTFAATLASAVPNSGTATVLSPNIATSSARIEVACHDNIFFDISPGNFAIIVDDIFFDGFEAAN